MYEMRGRDEEGVDALLTAGETPALPGRRYFFEYGLGYFNTVERSMPRMMPAEW